MPRAFPGSLQNFFNVMPQHRCSIIKDGISSFSLIIFKRINIFNLQTRRAILREVITHGETYPLFSSNYFCILPIMIRRSPGMTNTGFSTQHLNNLKQIQGLLPTTMER